MSSNNASALMAARNLLERQPPELDLNLRLQALGIAENRVSERERAVHLREEVFKRALSASGKDIFLGNRSQSEVEAWILRLVEGAAKEHKPETNTSGFLLELEEWVMQVEAAHVENHRYEARLRYDAHRLQALDAELRVREQRVEDAERALEGKVTAHEKRLETTAFAVSQLDGRAEALAAGERELARWLSEANKREEEFNKHLLRPRSHVKVGPETPMISDDEYTALLNYGLFNQQSEGGRGGASPSIVNAAQLVGPHQSRAQHLPEGWTISSVGGENRLIRESKGLDSGLDPRSMMEQTEMQMGVVADETQADSFHDDEEGGGGGEEPILKGNLSTTTTGTSDTKDSAVALSRRGSKAEINTTQGEGGDVKQQKPSPSASKAEAELREDLEAEWSMLRTQQEDVVALGDDLRRKEDKLRSQAAYLAERFKVLEDLARRWEHVHGDAPIPEVSLPKRKGPLANLGVQCELLHDNQRYGGGGDQQGLGIRHDSSSKLVQDEDAKTSFERRSRAPATTLAAVKHESQSFSPSLSMKGSPTSRPNSVYDTVELGLEDQRNYMRKRLIRFYAHYEPTKSMEDIEKAVIAGGFDEYWADLEHDHGLESDIPSSSPLVPHPKDPKAPPGKIDPELEKAYMKKRLMRFYGFYSPKTEEAIEKTIEQSSDPRVGWNSMWKVLEQRYGPEARIPGAPVPYPGTERMKNAGGDRAPSPQPSYELDPQTEQEWMKKRLTRFFNHYQPEPPKSQEAILEIVRTYADQESSGGYTTMWNVLEERYGYEADVPEPMVPAPTNSKKKSGGLLSGLKDGLFGGRLSFNKSKEKKDHGTPKAGARPEGVETPETANDASGFIDIQVSPTPVVEESLRDSAAASPVSATAPETFTSGTQQPNLKLSELPSTAGGLGTGTAQPPAVSVGGTPPDSSTSTHPGGVNTSLPPTTSDEEREWMRKRLIRFYGHYPANPPKTAKDIDTAIEIFSNPQTPEKKFADMWKILEERYGPESAITGSPPVPHPRAATAVRHTDTPVNSTFEAKLSALVVKYNLKPRPFEQLTMLKGCCQGWEDQFLARAEERYLACSQQPSHVVSSPDFYERQLVAFYQHFQPSKPKAEILPVLQSFAGLEEELFVILEKEQGDQLPNTMTW